MGPQKRWDPDIESFGTNMYLDVRGSYLILYVTNIVALSFVLLKPYTPQTTFERNDLRKQWDS